MIYSCRQGREEEVHGTFYLSAFVPLTADGIFQTSQLEKHVGFNDGLCHLVTILPCLFCR